LRDIKTRENLFHKFLISLNLKKNKKYTLILKISSKSSLFLSSKLLSYKAAVKYLNKNLFTNSIFIGILFLSLLYFLILFFQFHEKCILWFLISMLSFTLFFLAQQGYGVLFFWYNHLYFNKLLILITNIIFIFSFSHFFISFLETKKYFKIAHYFFLSLSYFILLLLPFISLNNFIPLMKILLAFLYLTLFIAIPIALIILLRGYTPAKPFLISLIFLNLTGILRVLTLYGILKREIFSDYSYIIIISISLFFFIQAMGEKISFLKTEKTTAEESLDLTMETINLGTWNWDIKKDIITRDKRWQRIIITPKEGENIDDWLRLIHPDDIELFKQRLDNHLKGKTPLFEIEYRIKTHNKKNEWIWVFDRGKVIEWSKKGEPLKMVGVLIDITEQKKAEEKIKKSEKLYGTLFSAAGDAILLIKDDIFIDCNKQALKIFECTKDQLIGSPPYKFSPEFQPDGKNSKEKAIEKINAALNGKPQLFEWVHLKCNGKKFDAEVSLNSIELQGEIYIQVIIRDITQKKHSEKMIKVLKKAGESMQTALTRSEIFKRVSRSLKQNGFYFNFFILNEEGKALTPTYISFPKTKVTKLKNIIKKSKKDLLKIPVSSTAEFSRVINNKKSVFLKNPYNFIKKVFKLNKEDIKQIIKLLKLSQLVISPFLIDERVEGAIIVISENLKKSDITAIEIFAHQISEALQRAQHFEQLKKEITIRKRAEKRLKAREEFFRSIIENAQDNIIILDEKGKVVFEPPSKNRVLGYPKGTIINNSIFNYIHPDDKEKLINDFKKIKKSYGESLSFNYRVRHFNGHWLDIEGTATNLIKLPSVRGIILNYRDVTERNKLQKQLIQSQKMEAIGKLAGGIAHDFNNLLTVIKGYTNILLKSKEINKKIKTKLENIQKASERAESLTKQLLAFSRKQTVRTEIVNLNTLIENSINMLKRLIGEDIEIKLILNKKLPKIEADQQQIEQILVNLVINARDAILEKKENSKKLITIETKFRHFEKENIKTHLEFREGDYVELSVSDTGKGIKKENLSKIFEPFFTTKEKGKGTGLGLSTVYGIIKQNNGYINVYSEENKGTTFKIYWPVAKKKGKAKAVKRKESKKIYSGKGELIFVVEDDKDVRNFITEALASLNYNVISATNGKNALVLLKEKNLKPHLLITDIIMPEMNGKELSVKIKELIPDIKVLFTSGYTDNHIVNRGFLEKGINFLGKPYTIENLSQKIRKILRTKK